VTEKHGAEGSGGSGGFVHETATFRDVWRNQEYRRVISAQFFSNVGTWMEMFAISMFVAQATGRLDDQGALGMVQQLPIAGLGIIGGLAADRLNRRALLVYTQVLAGIVALGVAAVSMIQFEPHSRTAVNILFALGLLNGVVLAFNFPAWQVLTPRLVPREQLSRAIALNGILFNLARVVGPFFAGLVLWLFGLIRGFEPYSSAPCFIFNGLSFFLVAWVVARSPDAPAPPHDGQHVLAQLGAAWKFIIHKPGPRTVVITQVLLSFLAAPMVRMLTLFVIDVYGISDKQAKAAGGILLAMQGVGAVIGGMSLRFIPPWYPKHHFMPLSVALLGMSMTLFSLTTSIWAGYAVMLICGFFWIWAFNQSWSAMQLLSPDHMRGRVMALATALAFGGTALGALIAGVGGEHLKGVISDAHATQLSVGGLSSILMLCGIFMMVVRTPEVDGLDRRGHKTIDLDLSNAVLARRFRPKPTEPPSGDVPPSASLPS
jgi:MFS family permease